MDKLEKTLNRFSAELIRAFIFIAIGYAWAVTSYGVLR